MMVDLQVLIGGLDTLEVIGRKAMDVIQEGDPGLRKKRAFLSNKKPNLSQVRIVKCVYKKYKYAYIFLHKGKIL